ATDDATEVNDKLGIQVPKCSARNIPAIAAVRSCGRVNARSSRRLRTRATGTITALPSSVRQKATAIVGASASRTSGPDVETAMTATARSTASSGAAEEVRSTTSA